MKEILISQLGEIDEQYKLSIIGSNEIDLTRSKSLTEILIDTISLSSPSAGNILLNLFFNADDILQNMRIQRAIDGKEIQIIYDDTKYTPEQIEQALTGYILQLKQLELHQGIDALKGIPLQIASTGVLWLGAIFVEPTPGAGETVAALHTIKVARAIGLAAAGYFAAKKALSLIREKGLVGDIVIEYCRLSDIISTPLPEQIGDIVLPNPGTLGLELLYEYFASSLEKRQHIPGLGPEQAVLQRRLEKEGRGFGYGGAPNWDKWGDTFRNLMKAGKWGPITYGLVRLINYIKNQVDEFRYFFNKSDTDSDSSLEPWHINVSGDIEELWSADRR